MPTLEVFAGDASLPANLTGGVVVLGVRWQVTGERREVGALNVADGNVGRLASQEGEGVSGKSRWFSVLGSWFSYPLIPNP
ncbi:MAG: hypothetical protein KatS3mg058_1926 [Roseiflexus sp.]|nr:MAG: hypothetical protein KatS3mg058_1926 [Roseiflexus sp.]